MDRELMLVFVSAFLILLLVMFLLLELSAARHKKENKLADEEMSYMMHDIKAPLNSIRGFAEGIIDGTIPKGEEEKYLQIIKSESERAAKIAEDYAVYKKLDSVRIVKKEVKIYDVICEIFLSFEKTITDKNITLSGIEEIENSSVKTVSVEGDKDLLHRAFYNLIENCVKYTPCGGSIRLHIKSDAKRVDVTLNNSGEIEKTDTEKIFVAGYRSDNSKNENGTGLGLSIVKKISQLHGGDVTARTGNGQTSVTVTIPVN